MRDAAHIAHAVEYRDASVEILVPGPGVLLVPLAWSYQAVYVVIGLELARKTFVVDERGPWFALFYTGGWVELLIVIAG